MKVPEFWFVLVIMASSSGSLTNITMSMVRSYTGINKILTLMHVHDSLIRIRINLTHY